MRTFIVGSLLLLATGCSASYLGSAVSTQYHAHDGLGGYSYGYADPNSQKHEVKTHGIVHGGYSYVDGHGHIQSVKYTADPIHGFHATGTNLPKADAAHVTHAYAAPWAYQPYALSPNDGTPIDTPEVQAAKIAHFAAHAEANSKAHGIYKRSTWGYTAPWSYAPAPVNGVPVDTAEVAHAKAEHLAVHSRAVSGKHELAYNPDVGRAISTYYPQHIPVIKNGVPVETAEVQHAKAAHFAAVSKAEHHQQSLYPEIRNGSPVETPEVQHAKAAHFAAFTKAGGYAPAHTNSYHAQHVPVIHNGVPVETPEVQHAKAVHFAAVAEAQAKSYDHIYKH